MRHPSLATTILVLGVSIAAAIGTPEAASALHRRAPARERVPRAALRAGRDAETVASAFDCDTPRGGRVYGSRDRCLRALCAHRGTNAYVLDATERLRANPCSGVDPFDLR